MNSAGAEKSEKQNRKCPISLSELKMLTSDYYVPIMVHNLRIFQLERYKIWKTIQASAQRISSNSFEYQSSDLRQEKKRCLRCCENLPARRDEAVISIATTLCTSVTTTGLFV